PGGAAALRLCHPAARGFCACAARDVEQPSHTRPWVARDVGPRLDWRTGAVSDGLESPWDGGTTVGSTAKAQTRPLVVGWRCRCRRRGPRGRGGHSYQAVGVIVAVIDENIATAAAGRGCTPAPR